MSNIIISDANFIDNISIITEILNSAKLFDDPNAGKMTDDAMLEYYKHVKVNVKIAKLDGIPAGFILIIEQENNKYPFSLYVKGEYRRMGIGSMLMENVIKYCNEQNAEYLMCRIKTYNDASENFSKKFGFNIVKLKFFRSSFDEIVNRINNLHIDNISTEYVISNIGEHKDKMDEILKFVAERRNESFGMMVDYTHVDEAWVRKVVEDNGDDCILLVFDNDKMIAMGLLIKEHSMYHNDDVIHGDTLWVDEQYRRKGVATIMILEAAKRFKCKNIDIMEGLAVIPDGDSPSYRQIIKLYELLANESRIDVSAYKKL